MLARISWSNHIGRALVIGVCLASTATGAVLAVNPDDGTLQSDAGGGFVSEVLWHGVRMGSASILSMATSL